MRTNRTAFGTAAFLIVLVGCAATSSSGSPSSGESADKWDPYTESPSKILPGASTKLSDLVSVDDIGKEFGVDDDHIPYPDTYWPFTSEGVDNKWNGSDPSPLEKAMSLLGPKQVKQAKDWEHNNHGNGVPGVASWWGHCPGWTGAAMFNKPILHAVSVKTSFDANGDLVECNKGEADCVTFEIGDINALEAEVFVDGDNGFLGARCDTKPDEIKRDKYGRIERNGSGCHGLNAGSLLVILGNRMKRDHLPMAIDAQNSFNTDQIWNQPAYRYKVNDFKSISKDDAIKLVAGSVPVDGDGYVWNPDAKGFVKVVIAIEWVHEDGPNTGVISGKDSTNTTTVSAVIELDKDSGDGAANVIGGEYLDDSNAGANRLTVPPFVWISHGPGSEDLDTSVGGNDHNPYVKPSFVEKLVQIGSKPAAAPPPAGG
jgi:hypothetical protein